MHSRTDELSISFYDRNIHRNTKEATLSYFLISSDRVRPYDLIGNALLSS